MKLRRVLLAAACAAIFALPLSAQIQTNIRALPAGQTVEREMTGAETHRYRLTARKDDFLQVIVEQKGVDVALKLLDANGNELAKMDSPNSADGPETLSYVILVTGSYTLVVSGFDSSAPRGRYTIRSSMPRKAVERDFRRVLIEKVFVLAITARDGEALADKRLALSKFEEALKGWQSLNEAYLESLTKTEIDGLKAAINKVENEKRQSSANSLTDSIECGESFERQIEKGMHSYLAQAKDRVIDVEVSPLDSRGDIVVLIGYQFWLLDRLLIDAGEKVSGEGRGKPDLIVNEYGKGKSERLIYRQPNDKGPFGEISVYFVGGGGGRYRIRRICS